MLWDSNGNYIEKMEFDKKIVMYGASTRNKRAIEELNIQDKVICFVDSDYSKRGSTLDGFEIISLDDIDNYSDCIFLSVLTINFFDIVKTLKNKGIGECYFYYEIKHDIKYWYDNNNKITDLNKNYKYLHIFYNGKFMKAFYSMIKEMFDINEHLFIMVYYIPDDYSGEVVYCEEENKIYKNILLFDNVHGIRKGGSRLINQENDCNKIFYSEKLIGIYDKLEKIFLHSAYCDYEHYKLYEWLTNRYSQKMAWICFGDDGYYYDKNSDVVVNILQKIKYRYVSKTQKKDIFRNYDIVTDEIRGSYAFIPNNKQKDLVKNYKGINILLGHAGQKFVNHKEGLELLSKFKEENINIYTPLSYGDSMHIEKTIKLGKDMFGDKFIPMTEFMELEEYYDFLKNIDIVVLPIEEACAGTTITYMSALNKKIYINSEILKYFRPLGFNVEDMTMLKDIEYEILCDMITTYNGKETYDKIEQKNIIIASEWKNVFEQ